MTTFTIGSGGTYATWAAAIAALPATLADDYDLVQVGDTNETTQYSAVAVNMNGYDLTLRSNSPHNGDPTAGHKILSTTDNTNAIRMNLTNTAGGTPTLEVKDLNVQWDCDNAVAIYVYAPNAAAQVIVSYIHDLILHNVSTVGTIGLDALTRTDGEMYIWNISTYGWYRAVQFNPSNLLTGDAAVENISGFGSSDASLRLATPSNPNRIANCACDTISGTLSSWNGYNNASVDGTAADGNWNIGSGNVTGITPANEFESLDPTNANFVKVKAGGSCEAGGTTPTISGNTQGIRGNARPHSPDVSIGADEYLPPSPQSGGGGGGNMLGVVMAALSAGY